MLNIKEKIKKVNKSHVLIAGALLLVLVALLLLWFNDSNSMQADSTVNIYLPFLFFLLYSASYYLTSIDFIKIKWVFIYYTPKS